MAGSSGYDDVASEYLRQRSSTIGVPEVRRWARTFLPGSSVLDLGCGPGVPITSVLLGEKLEVFGIDASPSFVDTFRNNLPGTPILCESVQTSSFFHRPFDGVLAIGLLFLLEPEEQRQLLKRIAQTLLPDGRLLFTSPAEPVSWNDIMTGRRSVSLGAETYRQLLAEAGMAVMAEYADAGENYYFEAVKR